MKRILIVKTGALGDVLRTTAVLPGLVARHGPCEVVWLTARSAVDLVASHPCVSSVCAVDPSDVNTVESLGEDLADAGFDLVVSLDDEEPLCRLATRVARGALVGAHVDADGRCTYTEDAEPWFGMGLLARAGKAEADRRKIANRRTHAEILAGILGVDATRPALPLASTRIDAAAARLPVERGTPLIGLNTGAGGRWATKALPVGRTVEVVRRLHDHQGGDVAFVLFGGHEEVERNAEIAAQVAALPVRVRLFDAGTENGLLDFASLVSRCDLLLSSDSLAMHVAIARGVPVVAFFAPTSAAEIDVFGRGEKVVSTSPDYCSYRRDADNSSITPERLVEASLRVLARARGDGPKSPPAVG